MPSPKAIAASMQTLGREALQSLSTRSKTEGVGSHGIGDNISLDDKKTEAVIVKQLSQRMPFVYAIAVVMVLLVSFTFYGTASNIHLFSIAIPLICVGLVRNFYWSQRLVRKRAPEKISRDLARLPFTASGVAVGLMVLGLTLYPLGTANQQALIHLLSILTCFVGILALNHSTKTALSMTTVSVVPSTIVFLYIGHENAVPICIAMVSVAALLLIIARRQQEGLLELIASKAALQVRETESVELNARLLRHAYVDDLTDIPNRRAFFEEFDNQLSISGKSAPWLALIDLDEFKAVNDLFGHQAGDAVLREVASRISKNVGRECCARLGGDEFACFLPGDLSESEAIDFADELATQIAQPIQNDTHALTVKSSIGIRMVAGLTVNECVERADWALYKAKQNPGSVVAFSEKNETAMVQRAHIAQLFDSADLIDELEVVYQPIVNFDSGAMHSVEVLARWKTKEGSLVMPDVFIPMAEHTLRISELTKIIVEKAVRDLPEAFLGLSVHVNLSAKDIMNSEFLDWLVATPIFSEMSRSQIVLELTETAILAGGAQAADNLTRLRDAGFRIALDDFGVGQSSLSRIHKLPLDQIKIDKSFCCEANNNEHGWAIIATILALSRQLGLECILEGIETEGQALTARSLGMRFMQGYHFSKPQSARYYDRPAQAAPISTLRLTG